MSCSYSPSTHPVSFTFQQPGEKTTMTNFQPIQLGDRVKDPITGLTGIVACITTWLHGCVRVGVQPESHQDGKVPDPVYFDQSQVQLVEAAVHKPLILAVTEAPPAPDYRSTGGPGREGPGFRR